MRKCPHKPITASYEDNSGRMITETYDFGPCDEECNEYDYYTGRCAVASAAAWLRRDEE